MCKALRRHTLGLTHLELELELIQANMTQTPMLRVEAGARALRMLVKNMCGWTERASAGVQGTCLWALISGAPVRAGWACDGEDQLFFNYIYYP